MSTPAEKLLGMKLDGGWLVLKSIPNNLSTGGHFSKCYEVVSDHGKRAFLKALDFTQALTQADPALILHQLTEAFIFERDILDKCRQERLDKIVIAIDSGTVKINPGNPYEVVQYLIFELADGDIRTQMRLLHQVDLAWMLRSIHHIAVGLQQLHIHDLAHQDLKPSNVLVFDGKNSKLADFGRSAFKGHDSPHESLEIAGDRTYAPPELLYGQIYNDWKYKKLGVDMYLFGSMVVFFFLGVSMTALLSKEMPSHLWFKQWGGTYEEVLPYLSDAFDKIIDELKMSLPDSLKTHISEMVFELCNPDPIRRGNLRAINQFSLESYISHFDRLARYAEIGILNTLKP